MKKIIAVSAFSFVVVLVLAHHFIGNGACQVQYIPTQAIDNDEWFIGGCPATATPSNTAQPTATNTELPTATQLPTATNTAQPTVTNTSEPTATNTDQSTDNPTATELPTDQPTSTAIATDTPQNTLEASNTPNPIETPMFVARPVCTVLFVATDKSLQMGTQWYTFYVHYFGHCQSVRVVQLSPNKIAFSQLTLLPLTPWCISPMGHQLPVRCVQFNMLVTLDDRYDGSMLFLEFLGNSQLRPVGKAN